MMLELVESKVISESVTSYPTFDMGYVAVEITELIITSRETGLRNYGACYTTRNARVSITNSDGLWLGQGVGPYDDVDETIHRVLEHYRKHGFIPF